MRKLVISVVVVVGLLVLADFGAAAYAEYRVSRELRAQLSLTADPDVRINGFPFLTQAAAGNYRSVDVRANGVPVTDLGPVDATATLRGVRLPPSQVLSGNVEDVVADSVDASVRVSATALGAYLDIPDLQVRTPPREPDLPPDAPQSRVILTGTVDLFGVSRKISVDAQLSLRAGNVVITAKAIDAGADGPSDSLLNAALSQLSLKVNAAAIPFGIVPTTVRAEGSEIIVEGTGTNVVVVGPDAPGG